jgi:hypothetical protein
MLLDELFDLWSDRCSVKAYHEQLTLHSTLLASPIPEYPWKRPTIALHRSNVSRIRGHIASSMDESKVLCLPIEVIPNGIDLLVLRHDDNAGCVRTGTCDDSGSLNVTREGLPGGGGWRRRPVFCYRCIGAGDGDAR